MASPPKRSRSTLRELNYLPQTDVDMSRDGPAIVTAAETFLAAVRRRLPAHMTEQGDSYAVCVAACAMLDVANAESANKAAALAQALAVLAAVDFGADEAPSVIMRVAAAAAQVASEAEADEPRVLN